VPDEKKVAKPKTPAKPKVEKAKAISKPKAKIAPKVAVKKPEVKATTVALKVRKVRGPNKKAKGSFAELQKIQAQFEEAKKGAKADLKKQYDRLIKEADAIKVQYKELFNEGIESAQRAKGTGTKKTAGKGFTLDQIQTFIDLTEEGKPVKIPGKNAISIAKIKAAYEKSKDKDAESLHELLK